MANFTCKNLLKVVALRALRLDGAGAIEAGSDSMYVHESPILLGYTPQNPDRQTLTLDDGNGQRCAESVGSAQPVATVNLRLQVCQFDAELLELLQGGSLWTDLTYGTIGYKSSTEDTTNESGTALEVWSIAWSGKQRAVLNGQPAWYRHIFPKASFSQDEHVLQNAFTPLSLTGVGEVNSGFGEGLEDDPLPGPIGDSAYGWFITDSKPDGECGYLEVA